ncbi:MAG: phage tail tape measure protein [Afipia sp.]
MAIDSSGDDASLTLGILGSRTRELTTGATAFSRAMTGAFTASVVGGRQFDDVLKSLTLRLSDMAVRLAFKPLEKSIAGGLSSLLSGLTGTGTSAGVSFAAASGAVKPFASGGVIGTPTYFPLMQGGVGLAGEAGPEAIMPLARGPDGKLGVAGRGGGNSVTIQIATPDLESFRRSENYITGQIARAVSRGQRSL